MAAALAASLALLLPAAGAMEPLYEVKPWRGLSDRRISITGGTALRAMGRNAVHAESAHFVAHAASPAEFEEALREAEVAWAETSRVLGLGAVKKKAHVFLLADREAWERVRRRSNWREDGRALIRGREVFVMAAAAAHPYREDIAHEVVHLCLRDAYGDKLPLWLEEGLAAHLGWRITRGYHELRGKHLQRAPADIDPALFRPIDELAEVQEYPEDPAEGRAFYRQVEAWMSVVAARIGDEQLGRFVRAVALDKRPWREVLAGDYEWRAEEIQRLEQMVEKGKIQK